MFNRWRARRAVCRIGLGVCVGLVAARSARVEAQHSSPAVSSGAAAVPPVTAGRSEAASAQVPDAASRPPLPNRVNDLLPPWLRVRGEFRERIEGAFGSGFAAGRDDAYALSRFRFNATVIPSKALSFHVQAQDARVAGKEPVATGAPFSGTFDLRQAFADVGPVTGRVAARVGRQELAYGDQRLVGHVSWLNTARTFDAVKVTLRSQPVQIDLFAASVVRVLPAAFDRSGGGNTFSGAYATTTKLVPRSRVEPYAFYRTDRNVRTESGALAGMRQATVGVRWTGALPMRLDYNHEVAVQRGSVDADRIAAWAGHFQLRESLPGPHAITLTGELNLASGDGNPGAGRRGTFDQLYPTPHDKYGLADQIGWKNIRHLRAGIDLAPGSKFLVTGSYHTWWLMDTADALYNAPGAAIARVAGGARSAHVGQELDVQISRPITPQLQVVGGLAHIFPGAFLAQATPGASYTFPYVMATYVFLADR